MRGLLIWLSSTVAIVFIIGAVMIQLAHKVHEIIFETADNVMRWIGFGVSALGTVKSGEVSVMGSVRGGLGEAAPLMGRSLAMNQRSSAPGGPSGGPGNPLSAAAAKQGQADVRGSGGAGNI